MKLDGKWGYINPVGEMILPCVYDNGDVPISYWKDNHLFSDGLAIVRQNGKFMIINKAGKIIVYDCLFSLDPTWSVVE